MTRRFAVSEDRSRPQFGVAGHRQCRVLEMRRVLMTLQNRDWNHSKVAHRDLAN